MNEGRCQVHRCLRLRLAHNDGPIRHPVAVLLSATKMWPEVCPGLAPMSLRGGLPLHQTSTSPASQRTNLSAC
jgi:hypothetical protein